MSQKFILHQIWRPCIVDTRRDRRNVEINTKVERRREGVSAGLLNLLARDVDELRLPIASSGKLRYSARYSLAAACVRSISGRKQIS
jgi:hypothetical protein